MMLCVLCILPVLLHHKNSNTVTMCCRELGNNKLEGTLPGSLLDMKQLTHL
jgi:hypothetical protein